MGSTGAVLFHSDKACRESYRFAYRCAYVETFTSNCFFVATQCLFAAHNFLKKSFLAGECGVSQHTLLRRVLRRGLSDSGKGSAEGSQKGS